VNPTATRLTGRRSEVMKCQVTGAPPGTRTPNPRIKSGPLRGSRRSACTNSVTTCPERAHRTEIMPVPAPQTPHGIRGRCAGSITQRDGTSERTMPGPAGTPSQADATGFAPAEPYVPRQDHGGQGPANARELSRGPHPEPTQPRRYRRPAVPIAWPAASGRRWCRVPPTRQARGWWPHPR
jgi:hypothetical protein